MQYAIVETDWGYFGFVIRGHRLVATFLPQSQASLRRAIARSWPDASESRIALPRFRRQVTDYFSGRPTRFDVQIDLLGLTRFREAVLKACRRVPYGKTASYGDLACAVGNPAAVRAVGSTMANNPLPLVIPCHRVLRADASIGGFSSPHGISEKKRLLALEGAEGAVRGLENRPTRRADGTRAVRRAG